MPLGNFLRVEPQVQGRPICHLLARVHNHKSTTRIIRITRFRLVTIWEPVMIVGRVKFVSQWM
jgi:hypothetical protein